MSDVQFKGNFKCFNRVQGYQAFHANNYAEVKRVKIHTNRNPLEYSYLLPLIK